MNKYIKWYNQIIEIAKNRVTEMYTERHHIVPRSIGGTDEASNLANLTAREHFICHWLLTKIYPTGEEHWKMLNAFRMMQAENPSQQRYNTKITSRVFANLKEEYSKLQSIRYTGEGNGMYGKSHTVDAKNKISAANKGRVQPQHEKEKQIEAMTGKKREEFSNKWRENLSKAHSGKNNPMHGKNHSEETRSKMSEKAKGRKQDPEVVKRKADAIRGLKREKKICPHCLQSVAVNGYARWHGENCKMK